MSQLKDILQEDIPTSVSAALKEDVGAGDITAALIPETAQGTARVITREPAILCGKDWVEESFQQVDSSVTLKWHVEEGQQVKPDQTLFEASGSLRSLLTAERCALNFLQLLSGTATTCAAYASKVQHTAVKILDTRKTIPGLRSAQKYAVTVGGCHNHRIGLYDAFLIKENHIAACGGIEAAINTARQQQPDKPVEVEVESFAELEEALKAGSDIIMLDNFTPDDMKKAVDINQQHKNGRAKLEASGGVDEKTLVSIAETGVDYISIGGLTKHCRAIDLSMRIIDSH